jgi:hypothetical protein
MNISNVVDDSTENLVTDTLAYCAQFLEKHNPRIYRRIIDNCRNIGGDVLKRDYYIPPSLKQMAYQPYRGAGVITVNRTQQEFCTRGRQMGAVIGRSRARSKPALHLAVVLDNSDRMTAGAQSEMLGREVSCKDAPSAFAKIAAIALLEATRNAKTRSLITFGADTCADINIPGDIDYGALLAADGAGCCRLDLALASLLRRRWDLRNGERQLIILTGMPPETGTGVLLDDIGVQETSLLYMRRMVREGVQILYLPILPQMGLIDTRIGAYTSRTFAQRIHELRIAVSVIGRADTFVPALCGGIKQMLRQRPN